MKPVSFFAEGIPKGQPRPRAFARKMGQKFVARVYDAGTAEGWKSCVAVAARPFLPAVPISDNVALSLTFVFPRPKAHFKSDGSLRPDAPLFHNTKPDIDNCYKAVSDALVTLGMFADDKLIVSAEIVKLYAFGERPGCRIEISVSETSFVQIQKT